jgi:hypothetical protein
VHVCMCGSVDYMGGMFRDPVFCLAHCVGAPSCKEQEIHVRPALLHHLQAILTLIPCNALGLPFLVHLTRHVSHAAQLFGNVHGKRGVMGISKVPMCTECSVQQTVALNASTNSWCWVHIFFWDFSVYWIREGVFGTAKAHNRPTVISKIMKWVPIVLCS